MHRKHRLVQILRQQREARDLTRTRQGGFLKQVGKEKGINS